MGETIQIKAKRNIFWGVNLILFSVLIVLLVIGFSISLYLTNESISVIGLFSLVFFLLLLILFLNLFFANYLITFDSNKIISQTLFSIKEIKFEDIEFGRVETGYKNRFEKTPAIYRLALYKKKETAGDIIYINLSPLQSIDKLLIKLESLGKLKGEKNYA